MRLTHASVHPRLAPWIDAIWVFVSDVGVPGTSSRVIAPNGKAKLILSFRNALHVEHARGFQAGREGGLHFIGVWDESAVISSPDSASGTIGIEFRPEGVCRFAGFSLGEAANRVCDAEDAFGTLGKDLERRLLEIREVEAKIAALQGFLLERMERVRYVAPVLDWAVRRIRESHGAVEIRELERGSGYSRRWLDRLFREHLGQSPKTLAAICRFQRYYAAWALDPSPRVFRDDLLDLYYDQSHFAREFKRFTGSAPGRYAQADNEFGRIFYRNQVA